MAVKLRASKSGALRWVIKQFVLAGLPTTNTFTFLAARSFNALPCTEKMAALAAKRSPRSMPALRGRAPTKSATSAPSKASSTSSVASVSATKGKAQSSISMSTPRAASIAG